MFPLNNVEVLVPHSGKMSFLSRVLDAGDDWLDGEVEITPDGFFAQQQGIPTWVGLEYMAQGIAAYSGYQESLHQSPPKIGFLVGSRRYEINTDFFRFGDILRISVRKELQAENGLHVFACTLLGQKNGKQQASGKANINVFQPKDIQGFLNGDQHV